MFGASGALLHTAHVLFDDRLAPMTFAVKDHIEMVSTRVLMSSVDMWSTKYIQMPIVWCQSQSYFGIFGLK